MEFDADGTADAGDISYNIDGRFIGRTSIEWPDGVAPTPAESIGIRSAIATLLAQYSMPAIIKGPLPSDPATVSALKSVLEILYDVRHFCDETSPTTAPVLLGSATGVSRHQGAPDARKVLVVLSGGFDSTLSVLALQHAGYHVEALHIRFNRHVEDLEELSARKIATLLGVPFHLVRVSAIDHEAIGRYYSRTFGVYPFYNSIPHGRDFLLATIASVVALHRGCRGVVFGHEKESRCKVLSYQGRPVYRHDVESSVGAAHVRSFISSGLSNTVELFSPLAGISIYRIRAIMLRTFPDICQHLQFCFWGKRCERCLKCLSTYTMQRHLNVNAIPFQANPFADVDDQDMALFARPDRPSAALAYGPQMHYAMRHLVLDGLEEPGDYWLQVFRQHGLVSVGKEWSSIESTCLDLERPAEVPLDVHNVLQELATR